MTHRTLVTSPSASPSWFPRAKRSHRGPSERRAHVVRSACIGILALVLLGIASSVLAATTAVDGCEALTGPRTDSPALGETPPSSSALP